MFNEKDDVLLFSLGANRALAKGIADALGLEIAPSKISHFADGETFAKPLCSVRGKKCYVIQSTYRPVDSHLMELLIFVDALKNGQAKQINLIVPYYGYARQDRICEPGDPVTAKLVAKCIGASGAHKVACVDLHSQQAPYFFNIHVDNLSSTRVFAEYYEKRLVELGVNKSDVCVVSPDHGGIYRARNLSIALGNVDTAIMDKRRPEPNKAEIVGLIGNVKDKFCILVDDIVDTGGTIVACTKELLNRGAKGVVMCATHGIFSHNAADKLFDAGLLDLAATDSIEGLDPRINIISVAPLFAKLIETDIKKEDYSETN